MKKFYQNSHRSLFALAKPGGVPQQGGPHGPKKFDLDPCSRRKAAPLVVHVVYPWILNAWSRMGFGLADSIKSKLGAIFWSRFIP